MNTNDLYLEYARVIKMCEGTKLEDRPWVCVQVNGSIYDLRHHPNFNAKHNFNAQDYVFAVAVLEERPVFVGDVIYDKGDWQQLKIISIDEDGDMVAKNQAHKDISMHFHPDDFTWTPPTPKRTFTLNGVELPCPVNMHGNTSEPVLLCIGRYEIWFSSKDDRESVEKCIANLLTEARDK